jgi:predicted esterase
MNGPSMRSHLGALGRGLEDAGLELLTPTSARRMGADQVAAQQTWVRGAYARAGQDADEAFADGVFWDGSGVHGDWLGGLTIDGVKTYTALEDNLAHLEQVLAGQDVVGVLGFSQGAAMAAVVLGRMLRGALPGGGTCRLGVLLSGFRPSFEAPSFPVFPVPALPVHLVHGTHDAIFADTEGTLARLASAFEGPVRQQVVPGLTHVVPQDEDTVGDIVAFVRSALDA